MIFFSHRLKIEKLFLAWCKEFGVAEKPNSLIAFMEGQGWLNEEKILEDLKEMGEQKKADGIPEESS